MKLQLMSAAVFAAASLAANASAEPKFGEIGLDTQAMDRSIQPGDDFYAYMNGAWMQAAKIPADTSAYGNFYVLTQQSLSRVREMDESAASKPKDANDRRFGDFYAGFMDEAGIERRGLGPLAADLKLIAGIETPADLAREMSKLQRVQAPLGYPQSAFPVSPGVVVDLKSTDHQRRGAGTGRPRPAGPRILSERRTQAGRGPGRLQGLPHPPLRTERLQRAAAPRGRRGGFRNRAGPHTLDAHRDPRPRQDLQSDAGGGPGPHRARLRLEDLSPGRGLRRRTPPSSWANPRP